MQSVLDHFLIPASPVLILLLTGCVLLLIESLWGGRCHELKRLISFFAPILSIFSIWWMSHAWPITFASISHFGPPIWLAEFPKHFRLDPVSLSFFWAISVFLFFSLLFLDASWEDNENKTEVFALMQFIGSGMMLLVSADSLLMVFTALELMSLPTYILVGLRRKDVLCSEAALKYFLFGSFASVLLLFAIALLYAQFATMHLPTISELVAAKVGESSRGSFWYASAALLLISVGFKVGMVPFHMWLPDTYEGAPSSVTGFMGSAVKLAGFGIFLRLWWSIFSHDVSYWGPFLATMSVITMFWGNIAALTQDNLKRLFAYSSISHAGYLLLGVSAIQNASQSGHYIYYYLVTYGLMFLGFFGVITMLENEKKSTDISSLAGLGQANPVIAICLSLFALSSAGIPPTAGFIAKYFLFFDAVRAGRTFFVVAAVLSSLIGVYYYLRILVYLYMKEETGGVALTSVNRISLVAVVACAVAMLYFGLMPTRLGL